MPADHERIDALLGQASDPVQRAIVIVLGNINRELQENTRATHALAQGVDASNKMAGALDLRITQHMADEEIMLAGFKGTSRFAIWLAPILFSGLASGAVYVWTLQTNKINELLSDLRATTVQLNIVTQKQLVNDERISSLERRQTTDESVRNIMNGNGPDPSSKYRNSGSIR